MSSTLRRACASTTRVSSRTLTRWIRSTRAAYTRSWIDSWPVWSRSKCSTRAWLEFVICSLSCMRNTSRLVRVVYGPWLKWALARCVWLTLNRRPLGRVWTRVWMLIKSASMSTLLNLICYGNLILVLICRIFTPKVYINKTWYFYLKPWWETCRLV